MMKYVTPSVEIFGMSCEDVETGDLLRSSREGSAQTISFLDSFRVSNGGTGGADEIGFNDLN